jgi:hypothetical protein
MREHYITETNYDKAMSSINGALFTRVLCGSRPTERAVLSFTRNREYVDCKRCLNILNR